MVLSDDLTEALIEDLVSPACVGDLVLVTLRR